MSPFACSSRPSCARPRSPAARPAFSLIWPVRRSVLSPMVDPLLSPSEPDLYPRPPLANRLALPVEEGPEREAAEAMIDEDREAEPALAEDLRVEAIEL